MASSRGMTRRAFIRTSICIAGLGLFSPSPAFASNSFDQVKTASDYWSIAEEKAAREESPIVEGSISDEELKRLSEMPQVCSMMTIEASSDRFWYGALYEQIQAALVVDHVSSTTVGSFMNTWVQMLYCAVSNLTYKRTILDSGKTQAIKYVFTMKSPYIDTYAVYECYCEFYYTGTGKMFSYNRV